LLPTETHLIDKEKHLLGMKGLKRIFQANGAWKQPGVPILLSDKTDFKPKLRQRKSLHIGKGNILSREDNNC
jgi:hypothetical protein